MPYLNSPVRVQSIPRFNHRIFFCTLCGRDMIRSRIYFICRLHGFFELTLKDGCLMVKKADAAGTFN